MEEETLRIWLEEEGGREREYELVGTFGVDEKDYMALSPMDGEPDEVVLIGFHAGEQDEILFDPIERDEEYEHISQVFLELFNETGSQEEYDLFEKYENERELLEEEDDYCYEDREGRLFMFDEDGRQVFLDENGEPIIEESEEIER